MYRTARKNRSSGHAGKRLAALAVLFCFVAVSLLATVFIVTHARHNCIGEGCPICAQMRNAERMLKQIATAIVILLLLAAALLAIRMIPIKIAFFQSDAATLVAKKIRMNL